MSRRDLALYILLLLISSLPCHCDLTEAQTKYGWIKGQATVAPNGKDVLQFLGVPFAKPPLGDLRFKFPVPPEPWNGIKDTTSLPNTCMQKTVNLIRKLNGVGPYVKKTKISEDCLYLNMWIPNSQKDSENLPNAESKLPVIIFFYGGAFFLGTISADGYDGGVLATEENVIVVSVNYRVASLGFLSLNDDDFSGNAGLADQQLAMRWVHEHVVNFGGDPEKVTLYGQSAGAASINFHMLAPSSWDYFQGAILQSGFLNYNWAFMPKQKNYELALQLAENIGCKKDILVETIKCLQHAEAQDILENEPMNDYNHAVFLPVVDGKMLTENPFDLYRQGKVKVCNIMAGVVKDEASIFMPVIIPFEVPLFVQNPKPKYSAIWNLLNLNSMLKENPVLLKMVEYLYTGLIVNKESDYVLKTLIEIVSDSYFFCPMKRFLEPYMELVQNDQVKVFTYLYNYKLSWLSGRNWTGIFHGADVAATFGHALNTVRNEWFHNGAVLPEDLTFTKRVLRYLGNFARTGNPNTSPSGDIEGIIWPEHSPINEEYLVLAPKNTQVGWNFRRKICQFLNTRIPQLKNEIKLMYILNS